MTRRTGGSRAPFVVGLALLAGATLVACGPDDPNAARPIRDAVIGGDHAGALLSAETVPGLDASVAAAGIKAARVTYRSRNADRNEPTVVSGTVFTPSAKAPPGGWRVVALGHGSTGIDPGCAPSRSATLAGQVELIVRLVTTGLVVTMTDYEGIGAPGTHPYLDSRTAGLNVIDSVRAARATFPDVSEHWAALGGSQGGGAVWAANELARDYATDLDFVGAVALAPAADLSGLVDKAAAGTLFVHQRRALLWALASLARLHPELDLDDFRRGTAAKHWDLLASCAEASETEGIVIGPDDLAPRTPAAAALAKKYLTAWALPRGPLSAPLLVAYGGKDTYVDPIWTTAALARACQLGGAVTQRFDPQGTHEKPVSVGNPVQWLDDRFEGRPAPDDCPGR